MNQNQVNDHHFAKGFNSQLVDPDMRGLSGISGCATPKQPEIATAIHILDDRVASLSQLHNMLFERIRPVMAIKNSPPEKPSAKNLALPQPASELGMRIFSIIEAIERISAATEEMMDMLEI